MRQQTRPFIVEIKQSRKPRDKTQKASIWGKLDLRVTDEPPAVISGRTGSIGGLDAGDQLYSKRPSVA
ncbi:hypothetical protein ACIQUG_32115 [Ensifer sp. NPDC090286]|uniref:hypothetical protein n=1 Tax=Ensifer sp. NPDC090286 TaxID=3363991 RepID=UPI00383A9EB0